VKITAALAASLDILTAALDDAGADIANNMHQLALDATAAVPSFLGLSIVISQSDPPTTITALADGAVASDVRTSLHLSLPGPGDSRNSLAIAIILYASAPGTFVDLAADLAWLTAGSSSEFILDRHLTLTTGPLSEGQLGVASDVNQAIGVLIGRGYTLQQAGWELDTQAANNGTDRGAAARLVLDKIPPSGDDGRFDIH